MSFALTTEQVRNQTKIETRRLGWTFLKAGDLLQPIVKGMGLKKGESPEKIGGPIRVLNVYREPLFFVCKGSCVREGFPEMRPVDFVRMFTAHNGCQPEAEVTVIEFTYTEPKA